MPTGYTALATDNDQDRELNAAFEDSDDEHDDHSETTPLNIGGGQNRAPPQAQIGHYDFERDFDWMAPPPGSPAAPTSTAVPNTIGNSNGIVPDDPVLPPMHPRPSFFRRALGAVLPSHYVSIPTAESSTRIGGGNDGVFANIMGKPQPARTVRDENGEVHIVPEEVQKDVPPTYVEAQADSVPPYWETTVHAPVASMADGEMLVDDLPTGSFLTFLVTMGISFFFQIVGFLLTYLLHTSHAGRYGALGGLGMTLIQFGFYTKQREDDPETLALETQWWETHGVGIVTGTATASFPTATLGVRDDAADAAVPTDDSYVVTSLATKDWLAFFVMTVGWFFLLSSIIGFLRVKRWERHVRASNAPPPTPRHLSRSDMQRDMEIRRNLESVFGLGMEQNVRHDENGSIIVIPDQNRLEEERLTRDLRAAGLL
ncbi:hypothetical protein DL96DRAFT_1588899 [Flagelloscypha sp. PMI_526]|nr:hypothetical protein DL96DRAFT_1588899 [Flagelloscypha sp. PMI_526]